MNINKNLLVSLLVVFSSQVYSSVEETLRLESLTACKDFNIDDEYKIYESDDLIDKYDGIIIEKYQKMRLSCAIIHGKTTWTLAQDLLPNLNYLGPDKSHLELFFQEAAFLSDQFYILKHTFPGKRILVDQKKILETVRVDDDLKTIVSKLFDALELYSETETESSKRFTDLLHYYYDRRANQSGADSSESELSLSEMQMHVSKALDELILQLKLDQAENPIEFPS